MPSALVGAGVLYTLLRQRTRVVQHRLVFDAASYTPRRHRPALPSSLKIDVRGFNAPAAGVLVVYLIRACLAIVGADQVPMPWLELVDSEEQRVDANEAVQRVFTLSTVNEDGDNMFKTAGPQSALLLAITFRPSSFSSAAAAYQTSNTESARAREGMLEYLQGVFTECTGGVGELPLDISACFVEVLPKVRCCLAPRDPIQAPSSPSFFFPILFFPPTAAPPA